MRKFMFLTTIIGCTTLFMTGCKSDVERLVDKGEELANEYINDLNDAKTKEEVMHVQKYYEEKSEFEFRKIMGADSKDELNQKFKEAAVEDLDWEDVERIKRFREEIEKAQRDAKCRTY